jgi:hypothetical protein
MLIGLIILWTTPIPAGQSNENVPSPITVLTWTFKIFYLVIRGGFLSPQAGFKEISPFGFASLAAIVGMFSEQAVLKLKEVTETVLAKPKPGEDAKPQDADT